MLESRTLKENEKIVSPDMKRFYNNVPVGETIETALRELYSSNLVREMPRSAMKCSIRLAVTNVHFICDVISYVQSYGLAVGASLAVILLNVWKKKFEASSQKPELSDNTSKPDQNGSCTDCNRRVICQEKE